jgi:endonuclease-8
MPEGDTIHNAAKRVGAALVGSPIRSIETPHPRHGKDRWPERLAASGVRSVDAHGKHLFVRFDNGLTLHSHLRMGGAWGVYPRGGRWHRPAHKAWLVIRTDDHEVVQFDGPVLELMTDGRTRFDQRLAALGPDLIHAEFDESGYLRRLREYDPTRAIGEALLDQRVVAGIGNVWKNEGCFLAGVSPWRRVRDVSDAEALEIVRGIRPLMQESAQRGGRITTFEGDARRNEWRTWVHERRGMPCRRCRTTIRSRGQGDDNRTTFWCPECER